MLDDTALIARWRRTDFSPPRKAEHRFTVCALFLTRKFYFRELFAIGAATVW